MYTWPVDPPEEACGDRVECHEDPPTCGHAAQDGCPWCGESAQNMKDAAGVRDFDQALEAHIEDCAKARAEMGLDND